MSEVMVTRGGKITLARDIREKLHVHEGDVLIVNVLGETALVSKRDSRAFEKHDFLPENFSNTLKTMRKFSWEARHFH